VDEGQTSQQSEPVEVDASVGDDPDTSILIGDQRLLQPDTPEGSGVDEALVRLHRLATPEQDHNAELVIGLVAPLGTNYEAVITALEEAFDAVGYTHEVVHVSDLLATAEYQPFPPVPESRGAHGYYTKRMDAGDSIRRAYKTGAALAAMAIIELRDRREALNQADASRSFGSQPDPYASEHDDDSASDANVDRPYALRARHVTILRTLKHPDEVALLRSTYRSRFVLIGITASLHDRRNGQEARLRDERSAFNVDDNVAVDATALLQRDGKDPDDKYGQNVRDTFELSDLFISTAVGRNDGSADVRRVIELIFGKPFITPRRDEVAMALARAIALRSADAGRQVGAVISAQDGSVIAIGCNEVPKAGGGQYWAEDEHDHRDFKYGSVDPNDRLATRMVTDALDRLAKAGWLDPSKKDIDPHDLARQALHQPSGANGRPVLKGSRLTSLMEFARVVHAEMAALSDAALRGVSVSGATLYTTAFPCHECARHIVAAGIARVVYVSPYPKSIVPELFPDSIAIDSGSETGGRVRFEPFAGVAPTLYDRLFRAPADPGRKHPDGTFATWQPHRAAPLVGGEVLPRPVLKREDDVIEAFYEATEALKRLHGSQTGSTPRQPTTV
jgi:deoxycytidylate deaminase